MKFLELRPFSGRNVDDVVRYLRVDVPKAFNDFFASVGNVGLRETYGEASAETFAAFAADSTPEDVCVLPLDPGTYNIFGIVQFDPNGATGTLSGEAWISGISQDSAPGRYGQSRAQVQIANVTPYVQALVFRRMTLGSRANVYLGAMATASTSGLLQRVGSIWAIGRQ